MPTPRKPTAGFWIVVAAVVLPVLYVLSFGPACWISSRAQPSGEIVSVIYRPLIEAMTDDSDWIRTPDWIRPALWKYASLKTKYSVAVTTSEPRRLRFDLW
ncbi:MAG: hypothetical protein EXS05_00575 [Planctomycetaceae bacterium]|nr:hypothetical protein [Planctomycetaceae bacterium]